MQHIDECDIGAKQRDESDAGAQQRYECLGHKCGICKGNAALRALFSIFKINIKSFEGM